MAFLILRLEMVSGKATQQRSDMASQEVINLADEVSSNDEIFVGVRRGQPETIELLDDGSDMEEVVTLATVNSAVAAKQEQKVAPSKGNSDITTTPSVKPSASTNRRTSCLSPANQMKIPDRFGRKKPQANNQNTNKMPRPKSTGSYFGSEESDDEHDHFSSRKQPQENNQNANKMPRTIRLGSNFSSAESNDEDDNECGTSIVQSTERLKPDGSPQEVGASTAHDGRTSLRSSGRLIQKPTGCTAGKLSQHVEAQDSRIGTNCGPKKRTLVGKAKGSSTAKRKEQSTFDLVTQTRPLSSEDMQHDGSYFPAETEPGDDAPKLMTWEEFEKTMEDDFLGNYGSNIEVVEDNKLIKNGNRNVQRHVRDRVIKQFAAQYGRILPQATDKLFREFLNIQPSDIFIDFGHGIGNAVFQAACTIGCKSRGIELLSDRHLIAILFNDIFKGRMAGSVDLRQGELQAPMHRSFLTANGRKVIKCFANNFDGVFKHRSSDTTQAYCLDDYVAGLFAEMKEGSIMATLDPLVFHVDPKSRAEEERRKHQHLAPSTKLSFYEMEEEILGPQNECVSWSKGHSCKTPLKVYIYKRVGTADFVCNSPGCEKACSGLPQCAYKWIGEGINNERIVLNHCECRFTARPKRMLKPPKPYHQPENSKKL